jgi:Cysteine-rich secretory protein family
MGLKARAAVVAAGASLLALGGMPDNAVAGPDWRLCPDWNVRASAETIRPVVVSVYCLLNAERMQYGLAPLRWNPRLGAAAERMGGDIVAEHFFAHDEPDGVGLAARVAATGYLPKTNDDWALGENLGWGQGARSTPASIVFGWMTSPGHRVNVLDPAFKEIGIACVTGSPFVDRPNGAVFVAEFGHARPDAKPASRKPASRKGTRKPSPRRAAEKKAAGTKPAESKAADPAPAAPRAAEPKAADEKASKLQRHR